jgi:large subunit ribosomal protein L21
MKYAVIQAAGKQYKVSEGDILEIDKLEGKPKAKISFDKVLLVVDGKKVSLGQPLIKTAKVTAEIIEQKKGKKIRVVKFKAKSRYRRVKGHRQLLTQVKINKIVVSGKKT